MFCICACYAEEIVTALQGSGTIKGTSAQFNCKMENYTYDFWRKEDKFMISLNDKIMNSRFSFSKRTKTESNIILEEVTLQDAGEYSCKFGDGVMEVTQLVELVVNKIPKVSVEKITDDVIEGEKKTLGICSAQISKPKSTIKFLDENGNEVESLDDEESEVFKVYNNEVTNTSKKLTLVWNKQMDKSVFSCLVEYPKIKPIKMELGSVDVKYKPSILFDGNVQNVQFEDSSLDILCVATGNPKPNLFWSFEPFENSTNLSFSNETNRLQILNLPLGINGTFTCTASTNLFADVTKSFQLETIGEFISFK